MRYSGSLVLIPTNRLLYKSNLEGGDIHQTSTIQTREIIQLDEMS